MTRHACTAYLGLVSVLVLVISIIAIATGLNCVSDASSAPAYTAEAVLTTAAPIWAQAPTECPSSLALRALPWTYPTQFSLSLLALAIYVQMLVDAGSATAFVTIFANSWILALRALHYSRRFARAFRYATVGFFTVMLFMNHDTYHTPRVGGFYRRRAYNTRTHG